MSNKLISINESSIADSPKKDKPEDEKEASNEKGEAMELAEI